MKSSKSEVIIIGTDFLFLSPILARVIKASQRMEFRFMVIGAVARDILFKEVFKCGFSLRATKDIDVAILIENWERFDLIMDEMIKYEGFVSKGILHRLYYNQMALDLIPFGSIATRDFIYLPPDSNIRISVKGFNEIYDSGIDVRLDDLTFRVPSLEGLFISKLVAWNERKDTKKTDAEDIGTMIYSYHELFPDDLFESHSHLIEVADYDYLLTGVKLMGTRLKRFLTLHPKLHFDMCEILRTEIADEANAQLAFYLNKNETYEKNLQALKIILDEIC